VEGLARKRAFATVEFIATKGVSDVGQVNADLVLPSGVESYAQEGAVLPASEGAVAGFGAFAIVSNTHFFKKGVFDLGDGSFDDAFAVWSAMAQG
jgi:prepilin signal peptidase PulO-like enzyme (type II secretory pathway)